MAGFEGSDYPYTLPVNMSRSVQVAFDAADHYPLLGGKLDRLWTSLTSAGAGYAHLGDHGRILMVTMFHEVRSAVSSLVAACQPHDQLHCLRALNLALGRYPNITAPHSEHCLSYLRSMTLCSADLTLEPVDLDAMGRIASSRASNATYTCADWGAVYGQMKHDHDSWLKHAATMSRAD
jgi:hypothetical protein